MNSATSFVRGIRRTEPRGVAALLLALVGIVTVFGSVFLGPAAIALAGAAKDRIDASTEALNGEAVAHAGYLMGIVATSLGCFIVLFLATAAIVRASTAF